MLEQRRSHCCEQLLELPSSAEWLDDDSAFVRWRFQEAAGRQQPTVLLRLVQQRGLVLLLNQQMAMCHLLEPEMGLQNLSSAYPARLGIDREFVPLHSKWPTKKQRFQQGVGPSEFYPVGPVAELRS